MKVTSRRGDLISQVAKKLAETGVLDLSGRSNIDLSVFSGGPVVKSIDISFTSLTSIRGLKPVPHLKEFVADDSALSSFENFASIRGVRSISMERTPLASEPYFMLSLVVVLGPELRFVDKKRIPASVRRQASVYPSVCAKLINAGWKLQYPCPNLDEIELLTHEYLEFCVEDKKNSSNEEEKVESAIEEYNLTQEMLFRLTERAFDLEFQFDESSDEEEASDLPLSDKIFALLHERGYQIDAADHRRSMLNVIESVLKGE